MRRLCFLCMLTVFMETIIVCIAYADYWLCAAMLHISAL
ncbi:hypothetical protein LFADAHJC_LOCUS2464 [Methylorubrum extorquens]